jgi:hypothetical protein
MIAATRYRWKRVAVSVSQILRLRIKDEKERDRYLLVWSVARQQWKPLGGVVKYYADAQGVLDELGFCPEHSNYAESASDLRGTVPGSNLGRFLLWLYTRCGREELALRRELKEELTDVCGINLPEDAPLQYVKTVHEGPKPLGMPEYSAKYRYFDFYDLQASDTLRGELLGESDSSSALLYLASKAEIDQGRAATGVQIADHARYFFESRTRGFEPGPRSSGPVQKT